MPGPRALLDELDDRRPFHNADSLSGSRFERARRAGEPVIVKYISLDDDWIMRATGDIACRTLRLFAAELPGDLPAQIDHATIAVAPMTTPTGHHGAVLLMHDVADRLIATGGEVIAADQHRRFLEHMALMHARMWGWRDTVGLLPLVGHYTFLTPVMAELEAARGGADPVPPALAEGWAALRAIDHPGIGIVARLVDDPTPLTRALAATPSTFVHADWKLGNLGAHDDGRTILLDWDRCGEGPATLDLAWYLAVNCDRLPERKEVAIDAYRSALEANGVRTDPWWDKQLTLALLGACLQMAWSKTGDRSELGWWLDRAVDGARLLA